MKNMFTLSLILTSLICWLSETLNAADPVAPPFLAGFAERDITPELGMEQPGGYGKSFHRTLHDHCKARAAVFGDGKTRVAVVSIDALFLYRDSVLRVREQVEQGCGIAKEAILIHATHSHSSGPTGMVLPGEYDGASELVRNLAYEESSTANPEYLKHVENQIAAAIIAADAAKAPAKANVGYGHEDKIAFNRRFFMKNGLTYTHPRAGNPDIIEPAGPIDPQVGVIGTWSDEGKLLGCIINYSCHATTNPGGISANYIHYLEQVIRGVFGDDVIVVFLAGASGDVTQVDNLTPYTNPKSEQWCRMVGASIGAEAVKVLVREEPGVLAPIAYSSKVWTIPRRVPSPEKIRKAEEVIALGKNKPDHSTWIFAKETLMLDHLIKTTPKVEVEVQAIQIGPVVLLTDPAEFFCELGLRIKEGSPFPLTFPVSLANGCVGYVPTLEAFDERGGGYETRLTAYSNLDITAGNQFVDAAIELSRKLTPGKVPTRPGIAPYNANSWGYGSVPPEKN
ncbi:MAG TPA: hypothetical protein VNQ76_05885 [Planctomicrobium sp.]|nr:hypothetical protein [Planctomicrobium sp.]